MSIGPGVPKKLKAVEWPLWRHAKWFVIDVYACRVFNLDANGVSEFVESVRPPHTYTYAAAGPALIALWIHFLRTCFSPILFTLIQLLVVLGGIGIRSFGTFEFSSQNTIQSVCYNRVIGRSLYIDRPVFGLFFSVFTFSFLFDLKISFVSYHRFRLKRSVSSNNGCLVGSTLVLW